MMGVGRAATKELDCPFCKKAKIKVSFKESFRQASASSISAGKKYTYQKKPEIWIILEDCPNCGAKKQDIQDMYDGKKKPETKDERKKRLLAAGIPTEIKM